MTREPVSPAAPVRGPRIPGEWGLHGGLALLQSRRASSLHPGKRPLFSQKEGLPDDTVGRARLEHRWVGVLGREVGPVAASPPTRSPGTRKLRAEKRPEVTGSLAALVEKGGLRPGLTALRGLLHPSSLKAERSHAHPRPLGQVRLPARHPLAAHCVIRRPEPAQKSHQKPNTASHSLKNKGLT